MCILIGNFTAIKWQVVHICNEAFIHFFYVVQNAYEKQEENSQRDQRVYIDAADRGSVVFNVFEHDRWIYREW